MDLWRTALAVDCSCLGGLADPSVGGVVVLAVDELGYFTETARRIAAGAAAHHRLGVAVAVRHSGLFLRGPSDPELGDVMARLEPAPVLVHGSLDVQ